MILLRYHSYYHLFKALVFALLIILAMPTFAAEQWSEGEFVKAVPRDGATGITNNHPLKISPQTLASILVEIKLLPKRADAEYEAQPLFSKSKAQTLGVELSEAFKTVGPNEDIAFQVSGSASLIGKLISKPVYTSGRIFWRNKRLQIIFGSIQQGVSKRMLLGKEAGFINPPKVGGRDLVVDSDYKPVLFSGSRYAQTKSGGERSNWLIIDPRETLRMQAVESQTAEQKEQPVRRQAPKASEARTRDSLEKRLRYLKSLREQDLISEEDYQYRVRQIIDKL